MREETDCMPGINSNEHAWIAYNSREPKTRYDDKPEKHNGAKGSADPFGPKFLRSKQRNKDANGHRHDEDTVLDRHRNDQRPDYEGEDPQSARRRKAATGRLHDRMQGVERACAEISIDNSECGQRCPTRRLPYGGRRGCSCSVRHWDNLFYKGR